MTVGSAVTSIDLHDIARAAATFGVKGFYVVTPYDDQAQLVEEIINHWTKGVGGERNPFRKKALELITIAQTLEETAELLTKEYNEPAVLIATSAKPASGSTISIEKLKTTMKDKAPRVLVFGTAWGLTDDLISTCHYILDPIYGISEYNHLSVRSAVSIYLDRIINGR